MQSLRDWIEPFNAFYKAANADLAPIESQTRLLLQAIDPTLAEFLRHQCKEGTPIFGDNSLVSELEKRFLQLNPHFKRMRDFLMAQQPDNTKFSNWLDTLTTMAAEAKLDDVSKEQLLCFTIMSSCRDKRLKVKLLKHLDPTVDKLCLLYTSPSPRDQRGSRMPSSA